MIDQDVGRFDISVNESLFVSGVKTLSNFSDELLNLEIFDTLSEAKVLIEDWRKEYNTIRPHSSLGYVPPAPNTAEETVSANQALAPP